MTATGSRATASSNDENQSLGSAPLANIRRRAGSDRRMIVLPEPQDDRVLQAADSVLRNRWADVTLLGDKDDLHRRAKSQGLDIRSATIMDPNDRDLNRRFAETYYQRRKHKGITQAQARDIVKDPLFFAASLVRAGLSDGMVAGSISPTSKVIRSALHCVGIAPGLKTISSFLLVVTGRVEYGVNGAFIFADGGCVPDPTPEQLADIALASAQHCEHILETEPLIAFLSFSTHGSAQHRLIDKVTQAVTLFQQRNTGYQADGELQLDAAIVPEVAAMKARDSAVAGRANVLIFPDLNAGNIGCKLVERLAAGRAIGPILQGLDRPVNDLSRGCQWQDVVDAVAITALQAQSRKAHRPGPTVPPSPDEHKASTG